MKESHGEGLASHAGSGSCGHGRKARYEAETGATMGQAIVGAGNDYHYALRAQQRLRDRQQLGHSRDYRRHDRHDGIDHDSAEHVESARSQKQQQLHGATQRPAEPQFCDLQFEQNQPRRK
jgi:hypothetical protein